MAGLPSVTCSREPVAQAVFDQERRRGIVEVQAEVNVIFGPSSNELCRATQRRRIVQVVPKLSVIILSVDLLNPLRWGGEYGGAHGLLFLPREEHRHRARQAFPCNTGLREDGG